MMKASALEYLNDFKKPVIPVCWPGHGKISDGHDETCPSKGKRPLVSKWQRFGDRLPTEKEVNEWFNQWPEANIGGPTGPKWGIALDIDPRHGGDENMDLALLPPTVTSLTGGGGYHYLFRHPGFAVRNQVSLKPGVDIRGDGGYIVLPPSMHSSGKGYKWDVSGHPSDIEASEAPPWLLDDIKGSPVKHAAGMPGTRWEGPTYEGGRNNSIASMAGYLFARGMKIEEVISICQSQNIFRFVPPLSAEEVRDVVKSIHKKHQADIETNAIRLNIRPFTEIKSIEVEWFWPGLIPKGKPTSIVGDPGVGKSFLTLFIAAHVSKGGKWPDGSPIHRGNVILVSAEDAAADTVKPRLETFNPDFSRIFDLEISVSSGDHEVPLSFAEHMSLIDNEVRAREATLLVVDPLLALLGKTVNSYNAQEVRSVLAQFKQLGEQTGCTVLSVMHPNKTNSQSNALYRPSASIDLVAAQRSVLAVGINPDDPDRRIIAQIKSNLSVISVVQGFYIDRGGFLVFEPEPLDIDPMSVFSIRQTESTGLEDAVDLLQELLSQGPQPLIEIKNAASELDISGSTLKRAKKKLGVESKRITVSNQGKGRWDWCLPENS